MKHFTKVRKKEKIMTERTAKISFIIASIVGTFAAIAGSQNGQTFNGVPIFIICVAFAFLLNWLSFIPAYFSKTEKYYDLIGSFTYMATLAIALVLSGNLDTRSILLAILVLVWAFRLGTFLFRRVHKAGKDDRFDEIKLSASRFLNAWTLQALWVVLTASPVLIAITSSKQVPLEIFAYVGLAVWIFGFVIEVIADYQKTQFRKRKENKNNFISTGLWSRSRHPNYFGEIVLWLGATIIAIPTLEGWQWIALISPIFVTILLTRGSGVPLLEAKADKKWGGQEDYESYKKSTPVLIPKLLG